MASVKPKPKATEQSDDSNINAINTATTTSLSGTCDLQYQLGLCQEGNLYMRIHSSSGSGIYSDKWISLDRAWDCLAEWEFGAVTALALFPLWRHRSINTAGFILSVLVSLGLLTSSAAKQRHWELVSDDQYQSTVKALLKEHQSKHQPKPHTNTRKRKAKAAA